MRKVLAIVLLCGVIPASAQPLVRDKGKKEVPAALVPSMSLVEGARICAEALVDLCGWPGACDIHATGTGKTPKALSVWVDGGHDAALKQEGSPDDSRGHVEVAPTTHGFSVFFGDMRYTTAAPDEQHARPGMFFCRYEEPADARPNVKLNMKVDIGYGAKPLSLYRTAAAKPAWSATGAPKKTFVDVSCRRPESADADEVLENADLFLSKFTFKGKLAAPPAMQASLCDGLSRCEAGLLSGSAPKAYLKAVSEARERYECKGAPSFFGPNPKPGKP